jgi:ribosomal protein S18 acetylase RimI-like enzyme
MDDFPLVISPNLVNLNLVLRKATLDDLDLIATLHEATFRSLMEPIVGWSSELQRTHVADELTDAGSFCIVTTTGEQTDVVVGHLLLRDDDSSSSSVSISRIMVQPEWQRRGIGTCVLRHVLQWAHAQQRSVSLTVWRANRAARRLYSELGFVTGERSGFKVSMIAYPQAGTHSDDDDDDDDDDD